MTLVVPEKPDSERDAVAKAWENQGGEVLRLGRFWEPPEMDRRCVRLYGNDTFCLVLAQILDLVLVSPRDELLIEVPSEIVGRKVGVTSLGSVDTLEYPTFAKSLVPKLFSAGVYGSCEEILAAAKDLPMDTLVLYSSIINLACEARVFVLDGKSATWGIYEGSGNVIEARAFADQVAGQVELPKTCVLDLGQLDDGNWVLLEANATWGAGLNGCDPATVADCLLYATSPNE